MRNDVKLGLAVGGLLLGVVLAYALFFSNNNKDHDKDLAGAYGTPGNSAEIPQRPATPGNNDQPPMNNNPNPGRVETGSTIPPGTADAPPVPAENNNNLLGQPWAKLLNSGTAGAGGTGGGGVVVPNDSNTGNVRQPPVPRDPPIIEAVVPSGPRKYVIKPGDSFWTIAAAEYGNAAYFGHIQRANPTVDPQRLKANTTINLPDKSEVIAAAAPRPTVSAAEALLDPVKQYRVQAGDNLSNISKKLYGRFDKWLAIYELNKELIGPNHNALKQGMILALPEAPLRTASTIN